MMSKLLKKLLVIFTIVITFFQNIIGVGAVNFVPEPLTVVYTEEYTGLGTTGSSIRVRKVKYTNHAGVTKYGYAYCLEGGGGAVFLNDEYVLDETSDYANKLTGELEDDGLRYIATNGFWGNDNVSSGATTADENVEYAITQLAIWLYYYDISGDEDKYDMHVAIRRISTLAREVRNNKYDSSNETFVKIYEGANELCEGAKKARLAQVACKNDASKCPVAIKDSLSVSVNNKTLKLTDDGKYFESDLVTVSLSNISKVKVSVTNKDFSVVNANNSVVSTVKNGDKVKVRIASDKVSDSVSVTLKFNGSHSDRVPYQYYGGTYKYNGETLAKQRLLFTAGFNTTPISTEVTFGYDLIKKDIEFSKIDVTTGKELPGATLEVRDSNGKLIESWVSTNKTHYIKLAPGKYTLTETIAPKGYDLSTETIEFEVKVNGTTTKVVMENKPSDVNVEFSKIDVTTGKELPGATLEVRDSNGKLIESWVSTDKTHYIKLAPGKYTLTETIAPKGYDLSTETIEFEVKVNGATTKVVMENKPSDVNVEFSKIDVTTGKELPGATLEVRDSNGKLIESWVSTNKTHYIKLAPGKYTLTEIVAPEGYILSNESVEFEVKMTGEITKVVMENKPNRVKIEFSKIDISTGKELPGAHLEIRDSEGNFVKSWISSDTSYYIELAPGKYTLTETIAPEGYELSTETIEFEVKLDGSVTKVIMENKPYIEVPITSLNASGTTMIIGSLLIGLGLIVVYSYVKKYEA